MSRKNKLRRYPSISPQENLSYDDQIALLEIKRMKSIEKAMKDGTPMDILRANDQLGKLRNQNPGAQKSYTFDPYALSNSFGFKDTNSAISYTYLRAMARTPLIRGVIDTRQNQMSNFSKPVIDDGSPGWTIKKKRSIFENTSDSDELTASEKKEIEGIMKFIENCGNDNGDIYSKYKRDTFEQFLRMGVRDSLTIDQLCFECVPNRKGDLDNFVAADGATMRFADEASYTDGDGNFLPEYVKHGQVPYIVQIYNRRTVADFYAWEMSFGIRNKSTDVLNNGYGVSELEDLVKIVTWMLFGDEYNGKFFSQGAAPKGILKVIGNVNQDRLSEFRMYWQQMVTGVMNAWRTPVLEADKVEWIDLQKSNQDMQFSGWQEYLVRVVCAVFKIDPTELGFILQGKSGGSGSDNYASHKQRTDYSKDKGLIPLLLFFESQINRYITSRITDKYEFRFTGIAPEDEAATTDIDVKRLGAWMTLNEVRAKYKLPPLPNGDVPLNAVYSQMQQMAMMGGQSSNEAVDNQQEEDGLYDENPFEVEEDTTNKSAFSEINDWVQKGMPETMTKI